MKVEQKNGMDEESISCLGAREAEKMGGKGIDNVSQDTHPGYSHGPYPY